jgi:hypothetical protein
VPWRSRAAFGSFGNIADGNVSIGRQDLTDVPPGTAAGIEDFGVHVQETVADDSLIGHCTHTRPGSKSL